MKTTKRVKTHKTKKVSTKSAKVSPGESARWAIQDDVIWRRKDANSIVAMKDGVNAYYFQMDSYMAEAWELLDGKNSVSRVCAHISKRAKVSFKDSHEAFENFLRELKAQNLVQIAK